VNKIAISTSPSRREFCTAAFFWFEALRSFAQTAEEQPRPSTMPVRADSQAQALSAIRQAKNNSYNSILRDYINQGKVAGVQACVVEAGSPAWAAGHGWADIERRIPMTSDTVMNIASVSKTVTATAIMQLKERRRLDLDADVNHYLGFSLRNPFHATRAITLRQLLTHTSSIRDGPAYSASYTCDSTTDSLQKWISQYFAQGEHWRSSDAFHPWAPGGRFEYSNVAFGVLGCVIEAVSGRPFSAYCTQNIFRPLGMTSTVFGAAKVTADQQAVPYTLAVNHEPRGRTLQTGPVRFVKQEGSEFAVNCQYTFPNLPDGLVRTSAHDFAWFVSIFLNGGQVRGKRILDSESVAEMLMEQYPRAARPPQWPQIQGLAWYGEPVPNEGFLWEHSGSDPGVSTLVLLLPARKSAVVLFCNTAPADGLTEPAVGCLRKASNDPSHTPDN
jgi:CubicO group peptidase (beta-lactamase class C family)